MLCDRVGFLIHFVFKDILISARNGNCLKVLPNSPITTQALYVKACSGKKKTTPHLGYFVSMTGKSHLLKRVNNGEMYQSH